MRTTRLTVAASVLVWGSGLAHGQCVSEGPDATISEIASAASFAVSDNIAAYALGPVVCNRGSAQLPYGVSRGGRPLIAPGLFRVRVTGNVSRIEQIGLGWVFRTFLSLQGNACCATCTPPTPNDGNALGSHCSVPETATITGSQPNVSPRFGVNPVTGDIENPSPLPAASTSIDRRLQVAAQDMDPSVYPGSVFYAEQQIISPDDVGVNRGNNSSFRRVNIVHSGANWTMTVTGATSAMRPAIYAWQDADGGVVVRSVEVSGDGQFLVGARAMAIGGGLWQYEYAVQNVSSHRGAAQVAVAAPPDVTVTNAGFHDVAYHSGDGLGGVTVDGTDWAFARRCADASWATQPFGVSQNANALRWGTLYNVRFTADSGPTTSAGVTLGLYRPGTPTEVVVAGVPTPRARWDTDGDGQRTPADVAAFVNQWFANLTVGGLEADYDRNGSIQPADIAAYLNNWVSPPGC